MIPEISHPCDSCHRVNFYFYHLFYIYLLLSFWKQETFSPIYLLIYLFVNFYHYGLMVSYFIQWITFCNYYFCGQIVLDLSSENLFKLISVSIWHGLWEFLYIQVQYVPDSFWKMYAPALESLISPRSPGTL